VSKLMYQIYSEKKYNITEINKLNHIGEKHILFINAILKDDLINDLLGV